MLIKNNSDKNDFKVTCDYCGDEASLVGGDIIYPYRPDLATKKFWYCYADNAYVGTHQNSSNNKPLGRLANKNLRKLKSAAHSYFDPLWKRFIERDGLSKSKARKILYKWLAKELDIEKHQCHIGMFDEETCKRVIDLCKNDNKISELFNK